MLKVYMDIETLPPDERWRSQFTSAHVCKLENRKSAVAATAVAVGVVKEGAATVQDVTYREAETNREETAACTDEEFSRLALHGEYGRVLCIGVIIEDDERQVHRGVLGRERRTRLFHLDERRTLSAFWGLLANFNTRRDIIIGHNVMDFDLPFLYKRSVICGVEPSVRLSFARYRSQPIFDTMREWAHWQWRGLSLAELSRVLNLESSKTEGMDGGRVYEQFRAGEHERIAAYCLQDVEVVRLVHRRMCFVADQ